jgi:hypothetical protein
MAKEKVEPRSNVETAASGAAAILQFEPFLSAGNKALEAWTAIGTELIEFGMTRVDRGIELGKAMAQSSSLNEAMGLQAKFAQSMVSDLLGEASKLAGMSTRPMIESFAAMPKTTRSETPPAEAAA